jgi:thermitase
VRSFFSPRQIFALIGLVLILAGGLIWNQRRQPQFPKFEFVSTDGGARGPASGQGRGRRHRPASILYKTKKDVPLKSVKAFEKILQNFDLTTETQIRARRVHFAKANRLAGLTENEIIEELKKTGAVEFAEVDRLVELTSTPDDPLIESQWHHQRVMSFLAWDITYGSNKVLVANCDTGIDSSHPDLRPHLVLPGYNSEDGSENSEPVHPHGTMTAGVTAAVANNKTGLTGIAGNIELLPVRVTNFSDGGAYFSAMANCIVYAADRGAKVVNLSYAGADSFAIDEAAQYLRSKGGLLVMAAGNSGVDMSNAPDFSSFVIVGATDQSDNRPTWSNYGSPIDIVAPGVDILTTIVGGTYAMGTGTSFSAPIVSGAAALIFSLKPEFTPAEVENFLFSTAHQIKNENNEVEFGHGLVDVSAAVTAAKNSLVLTSAPTPTPNPSSAPSDDTVPTTSISSPEDGLEIERKPVSVSE